MSTIERNRKIGGTNQFETEFQLGFDDIRAQEVDDDLNTIYNAWNTQIPNAVIGAGIPPTGPASGDLTGTYPSPSVKAGWVLDPAYDNGNGRLTPKPTQYAYPSSSIAIAGFAKISFDATGEVNGPNISGQAGLRLCGSEYEGINFRNYDGSLQWGGIASNGRMFLGNGADRSEILGLDGAINLKAARAAVDGTLQYANGHIQARVAGAWTNLDGQAGGATPTGPAGGSLTGTYPNPTIANLAVTTAMLALSSVGSNQILSGAITPVKCNPVAAAGDVGKIVTINATTAFAYVTDLSVPGNLAVVGNPSNWVGATYGAQGWKSRWSTNNFWDSGNIYLTTNLNKATSTQDDAASPSWQLALSSITGTPAAERDRFKISRSPIGSTTLVDLLNFDSSGNYVFQAPTAGLNFIVRAAGQYQPAVTTQGTGTSGTMAAPTQPGNGDIFGQYIMAGWNGSGYTNAVVMQATAAQPWNGTVCGSNLVIKTNILNTNTLGSSFTLSGQGDFTISGTTGTKATGTTWSNPSDPRLKRNTEPYLTGLDAITALEPITFFYNGKGGTVDDGLRCYGYDAEAVQSIFPAAVGTRRGKLDPDDEEDTDILTLDTSNFTLALINAVKELAARVTALEQHHPIGEV